MQSNIPSYSDVPKIALPDAMFDLIHDTNNDVHVDPLTGAVSIETADGGVDIDLNPEPEKKESKSFNENLVNILSQDELNVIAADLLEGIEADIQSRLEWEENMADAMIQLGLKKEQRSSLDLSTVSKCRHPILLETVMSFWAQFVAEFLPAAGPCKVASPENENEDEIAQRLEKDVNLYLTETATEYYPDTSRAGLRLGLSGGIVKKVYYDQVRERPVSEAVYLDDLIVSNDITDLQNAQRVTHRIQMLTQDVTRMQSAGVWADVEIGSGEGETSRTDKVVGEIEGMNPEAQRTEDRHHTIYESQTKLTISGDNYSKAAKKHGFPSPYLVTIDKDSQKVLAIYRNWKQDDAMYKTLQQYVPWFYCPGLGWYPIGLAQILANSASTLTSLWREIVDAGMFANFPGFLYKDALGKQDSMVIRVQPGSGAPIKVPMNESIQSCIAPLPYKDVSPTLLSMAEKLEDSARKLASAAQVPVGEGTANIPVGTIVAMIEQGTKVLQAIHKGLHNAQKRELELLKDLFVEHPEDLTKFSNDPNQIAWTSEQLKNHNLVPASDPNTPSSVHRISQAMMIGSLAQQAPGLFDLRKVAERILKTAGVSNIDELFAPEQPPQSQQPPVDPVKMQEVQLKGQEQQRKAASDIANNQAREKDLMIKIQSEAADRQSKEKIAMMNAQLERERLEAEMHSNDLDRQVNHQNSHFDRQADLEKAHAGFASQHLLHLTPKPDNINQGSEQP